MESLKKLPNRNKLNFHVTNRRVNHILHVTSPASWNQLRQLLWHCSLTWSSLPVMWANVIDSKGQGSNLAWFMFSRNWILNFINWISTRYREKICNRVMYRWKSQARGWKKVLRISKLTKIDQNWSFHHIWLQLTYLSERRFNLDVSYPKKLWINSTFIMSH